MPGSTNKGSEPKGEEPEAGNEARMIPRVNVSLPATVAAQAKLVQRYLGYEGFSALVAECLRQKYVEIFKYASLSEAEDIVARNEAAADRVKK